MGLSAFNAMRARLKAQAEALEKEKLEKEKVSSAEPVVMPDEVKAEVKETLNVELEPEKVEDVKDKPKKTDAEKLKKKKKE